MKNVKINLDISHWVVCLERIFATESSLQENGPVDTWWPEVLEMLKSQCCFIHARVGYGEGPQVPDPSAPEYKNEVAAHMMYWSEVMKGQIANKRICFVEPEHGPWPYQQSKPHNNTAPVTDIWVANNYVAKLVSDAFPKLN